jgi:ABC-type dipeptide/oligopeptide/nickel transport system ATPase component
MGITHNLVLIQQMAVAVAVVYMAKIIRVVVGWQVTQAVPAAAAQ